jgi:hypothetical protein
LPHSWRPLHNSKWVVYCKHPFGGPKQVLRYLTSLYLKVTPFSSAEPGFHRVSLAIMSDDKSTGGLDILRDAAV